VTGIDDASSAEVPADARLAEHAGGSRRPAGPASLARLGDPWSGRVVRFDDAAGLGIVEATSGEQFGFHCTSLADGSRHVERGRQIVFGLRPGLGGEIEAVRIVVVDGARAAAATAPAATS
jgi:cold shock CspA family protein